MSYNELLKLKLRGNLFGVGFFLLVSGIMLGFKLNALYGASPNLIDIQTNLLAMDWIVIIIFGIGVLALLVSLFLYLKFDNYYPQTQIKMFVGFGVLFLPFTIILLVIGIMKYMEKQTFKFSFFGVGVLSLLLVGVLSSVTVNQLQEIQPIYTSKYVFEAEYILGADDYVEVEVTAIIKGNELISVTVDAIINSDLILSPLVNPIPGTYKQGEYYRMSVNDKDSFSAKPTCFNIPSQVPLDMEEFSCEITEFEGMYEEMEAWTFKNFKEFYFEYGYMDSNGVWTRDIASEMTLTNQYVIENIYETTTETE